MIDGASHFGQLIGQQHAWSCSLQPEVSEIAWSETQNSSPYFTHSRLYGQVKSLLRNVGTTEHLTSGKQRTRLMMFPTVHFCLFTFEYRA